MAKAKKVLIVDDNQYWTYPIASDLSDMGITVVTAATIAEAKKVINADHPDVAVVDVELPPGEGEDSLETRGGFQSGVVLARWIRQRYPDVKILGLSIDPDPDGWFSEHAEGFMSKREVSRSAIVERVIGSLGISRTCKVPRSFIVHGHDDKTKLELKNYLQNELKFPEPFILHERPNLGRTIIEKLEGEAANVDIVFVLLNPDDQVANVADSNEVKRRARQNVIFEMGYFLGKIGRRGGRIILLYKGGIELPSDISGLIYIDISNGIEAAGETIRREIQKWL